MRGALNSKNFLVSATILAVVFLSGPTEAKRLGGGGSVGRQSPAPASPAGASGAQRSATPPGSANQTAPAGAPASPANASNPAALNRPGSPAPAAAPASPWKRMLGAAAVGLGIAALASWMGVSSELASVLGIALVGLLVLALVTAFFAPPAGGRSTRPRPFQPVHDRSFPFRTDDART